MNASYWKTRIQAYCRAKNIADDVASDTKEGREHEFKRRDEIRNDSDFSDTILKIEE